MSYFRDEELKELEDLLSTHENWEKELNFMVVDIIEMLYEEEDGKGLIPIFTGIMALMYREDDGETLEKLMYFIDEEVQHD